MQEDRKELTGSPVATHTFNRAAETTLRKANQISNGRAGEYQDSWSLDNLMTPWLDNLMNNHPHPPATLRPAYRRLVVMASMLDIKLSRLGGSWKEDTAIDSINYLAAYCQLREEFEKQVANERMRSKEPTSSFQSVQPWGNAGLATQAEPLGYTTANLRT